MQGTIDTTAGNHGAPAPGQPWICALHDDLLGRPPEPHDLLRWTDAARGGASHRELAERFLRSPDYCSHQVATLYRCLLDRDGDPAAIQAWTQSLAAGAPVQNVITGLCDSSEYRTLHPPPATFVESLYERLLNRTSDDAGKAGWLRALRAGASTLSAIQGILRSPEFCTRYLTELHLRLLDREPDRPDLLRRVVAAAQGTALQHFALEIVTSAEYIARATGLVPAASAAPSGDAIPPTGDVVAGSQGRMQDQTQGPIRSLIQRLVQHHSTAMFHPRRTDPPTDLGQ